MNKIGIEKMNLYGCSLCLDMEDLALARKRDPQKVVRDYMINTRSLNPPWEDTVTMGVNAANPMLSDEDKKDTGLLIVGTEGSLDFGKPISTNIHEALGLHPNIRNFETKHACYSGIAALDTAINWIASGNNNGKKALIISTDFSRTHINEDYEFIMGGVAIALLVSNIPKIIAYEPKIKGTWTTNAYDTFRPTAHDEIGNNEESLFTYIDALEGAYTDYKKKIGAEVDFDNSYKNCIYHMPFPGMAFQAHRTLCNIVRQRSKKEIQEDFNRRVLPSLFFAQKLGSIYGASNFVGLCGVLHSAKNLQKDDQISFFAYGSGAIGEFYIGKICEEAPLLIKNAGIDKKLNSRRIVSVDEYEMIERQRTEMIEKPYSQPDFSILNNWYDQFYKGKNYLVLEEVNNFRRKYIWS